MRGEILVESKKSNWDALEKLGVEIFPYSFDRTHSSTQAKELCKGLENDSFKEENVSVAGRVISRRRFGKLYFFDLLDEKGKIQTLASVNVTDKEDFKIVEFLDTGDFIGVTGKPYLSKKGEPSVFASNIKILAKSLLPMPEKWHGLIDVEVRHRKRHLDLIMNPETREIFKTKTKIIQLVRSFLDEKEFLEVEIPVLQPVYGGANARPFKTESFAWKSDFYLSISPELYLKRLLVGGFERVYTVCRNFRNEASDKTHNPEFTMLEFYAAYLDYNQVMKLTEDLVEFVVKKAHGSTKVNYFETEIDFKKPWVRMTMYEALKKYANLDVSKLSDDELKKMLKENNLELDKFKRGLAIAELFEHYCEEKLIQPTFITDHPKETTPLCKDKRGNPELIERFELYVNSWEMANAYSELNNPIKQKQLFLEQAEQGRAKGENHPVDLDFVETISYGMPPTGGMGLGIDRLVMLLTNSSTIRDVILFPQMRPEQKEEKKN
ncbi:MAG: lysine--tRNA ligase [archaeon]